MRGRGTKLYTAKQNADLEFYTLDVLSECPGHFLSIDEIKQGNAFDLGGVSSQKMSRVLSNLIMMGVVRKKKDGLHMKYATRIIKEGFESCEIELEEDEPKKKGKSARRINWEIDTEVEDDDDKREGD